MQTQLDLNNRNKLPRRSNRYRLFSSKGIENAKRISSEMRANWVTKDIRATLFY